MPSSGSSRKGGTGSSGSQTFRVVMLKAPESLKHKEVAMPVKELDETAGLRKNIDEGIGWAPVCTWYTLGNCRNGKDCRYIHPQWHLIEKYGWKGIAPHCEPEVRARIVAKAEYPSAPSTAAASPEKGTPAGSAAPTPTKAMRPLAPVDQLYAVLEALLEDKGAREPTRSDVAQEWVNRFNMRDRSARSQAIEDAVAAGRVRVTGAGADERLQLVRNAKSTTNGKAAGSTPSSPAVAAFAERLRKYFKKYDAKRVSESLKFAEANVARETAAMNELCARYGPENDDELRSTPKPAGAAKTNAWAVKPVAAATTPAATAKPADVKPAAAAGAWGKTSVWGGATSAAAARAALADAPTLDGVAPVHTPATASSAPEPPEAVKKAAAQKRQQNAQAPQPSAARQHERPAAKPSASVKVAKRAPPAPEAAPTESGENHGVPTKAPPPQKPVDAKQEDAPYDPWEAAATPVDQTAAAFPAVEQATGTAHATAWNPFGGPSGAAASPFEGIASSAGTTPTTAGEPVATAAGGASATRGATTVVDAFGFGAGSFGAFAAGPAPAAREPFAAYRAADGEAELEPTDPWGAAPDDGPAPNADAVGGLTAAFGSGDLAMAAASTSSGSGGGVGRIQLAEGCGLSALPQGLTNEALLQRLQELRGDLKAEVDDRSMLREPHPLPARVMCGLCRLSLSAPVELLPCHHNYCRDCLIRSANADVASAPTECKQCGLSVAVMAVLPAPDEVPEAVGNLDVKCTRCSWAGLRKNHATHECDLVVPELRAALEKARAEMRCSKFHDASVTCQNVIAKVSLDDAASIAAERKEVLIKLLCCQVEALLSAVPPVTATARHRALTAAQTAERLDDDDVAVLYWLGRAHQEAGNHVQAAVHLATCQRVEKRSGTGPRFPDVAERMKNLYAATSADKSKPPPYDSPQTKSATAPPPPPPPLPPPMPRGGVNAPYHIVGGPPAPRGRGGYAAPTGHHHHHRYVAPHFHHGHHHHHHHGHHHFHHPHGFFALPNPHQFYGHLSHHHHNHHLQHHRGAPLTAPGGKSLAVRPPAAPAAATSSTSSPSAASTASTTTSGTMQFRPNAVNAPTGL